MNIFGKNTKPYDDGTYTISEITNDNNGSSVTFRTCDKGINEALDYGRNSSADCVILSGGGGQIAQKGKGIWPFCR